MNICDHELKTRDYGYITIFKGFCCHYQYKSCHQCVNGIGCSCHEVIIVETICFTILIIALYGITKYFKWENKKLEELKNNFKKVEIDNKPIETPEKIKFKQELDRIDRVRALVKEIVSLSSDKIVYDETKEKKGYYEKYNDTEANNLFQLYQKLDKYIIIKEIADGEQQQS